MSSALKWPVAEGPRERLSFHSTKRKEETSERLLTHHKHQLKSLLYNRHNIIAANWATDKVKRKPNLIALSSLGRNQNSTFGSKYFLKGPFWKSELSVYQNCSEAWMTMWRRSRRHGDTKCGPRMAVQHTWARCWACRLQDPLKNQNLHFLPDAQVVHRNVKGVRTLVSKMQLGLDFNEASGNWELWKGSVFDVITKKA